MYVRPTLIVFIANNNALCMFKHSKASPRFMVAEYLGSSGSSSDKKQVRTQKGTVEQCKD